MSRFDDATDFDTTYASYPYVRMQALGSSEASSAKVRAAHALSKCSCGCLSNHERSKCAGRHQGG